MQKLKIQKTHTIGKLEEPGQEHGSRQMQTETNNDRTKTRGKAET